MRHFLPSGTVVAIVAVLTAVLCQGASGQAAQGKDKPAPAPEATPVPPRATAAEYQAHAQAGAITVAAEFTGHSIVTLQTTLSTDDYIVVEAGVFGPPGARVRLSHEDFSLRVNGNKTPLPAQPYLLVFKSLKDPEWEPPGSAESKLKSGLTTGGNSQGDSNPAPVHMPFELERAMQLRVQKASLPEGDRALPEAGLLYFHYGGRASGIHSTELIYDGPAGKAALALQP